MVAGAACGGDRRGAGCDRPRRRLPGEPRPAPARAVSGRPGRGRAGAGSARAPSSRRAMHGDGWSIVSATPELFLRTRGDRVWTMPIKGTRPADSTEPIAASGKDRAEHVMIVDLERNDLGPGVRPRIGAGEHVPRGAADGGRPPPRLDGRGPAAARRRHRRAPARHVPRRVGDGRAEAGGDRAHRPARAGRPRRLDGRHRARPPQRRPRPGPHDPRRSRSPTARSISGSAGGSCGTPTPRRRSRSRS